MRSVIAFSVLLLSLAGLSVGLIPNDLHDAPKYVVAVVEAENLCRSPSHYTNHAARAAKPEIVRLRIEGPFAADERAKILLAVEEWNYVLNGFIRLDLAAQTKDATAAGRQFRGWTINAVKGGGPQAPDPVAGQPLSFTQAVGSSGGRMVIYVDHIGTRDLRGVVLHELGHVLGLEHVPNGLMSPRYAASFEQCIDKVTVEAIAARRKLPLAELNWCETTAAAATL